MKMKIKRKRKIINNLNDDKIKVGCIFLTSLKKNNSKKKKILLNNTKVYNQIYLHKEKNINKLLSNNYNLQKTDIIDTILIYNKNIKLYIVILNYTNSLINTMNYNHYLDLYKPATDSLYYDILKSNDSLKSNDNLKSNYLSSYISDKDDLISIKIKDIYYYLIGYI